YTIDEKEQLIMVKDANGVYTTYEYADDLVVTIANVRFPTVGDLKTGDLVALTVKNNVLTGIELVQAQQQLTVTGEIISISTNNNNVSIKSSAGSSIYYLDKNVDIKVEGLNIATIHDLQEGDNVSAQINNGLITVLEVLNRDAGSYYSGTVLAVDTYNERIVIKTANGETVSYDLSTNVSVEIDGEYEDISDVKVDMEVDLTVVDDKVLYIEVASGAEGKVISINTSRNLISVQLNNGNTDSYVYSSDVDVNFTTIKNPDEFDIAVGDTVRIHANVDGLVYEIDVYCSGMFEVVSVASSSERLKVEDEDGDSRYLYLDDNNVTIEMAGVRNPTVDDFKVGDVLEVYFMGNDVRKIVTMQTAVGTITSINDATGVFSITDYDGLSHSFTFTGKSTVTEGSKSSSNISAIAVGDRVQVYETIDKHLEISLMTLVTGTIVSVATDYESVYIQKTGTSSYTRYYCDDDCILTEGGSDLAWRNLKMNDKVRLYVVGTTAYEIERY
ncbi:MAG: hypothetical protein Q4B48_04970, partial [Syntrophomonadaceae bacterium]|nr:hypothetical protein [Syntrophomonadaceae bacterium]